MNRSGGPLPLPESVRTQANTRRAITGRSEREDIYDEMYWHRFAGSGQLDVGSLDDLLHPA